MPRNRSEIGVRSRFATCFRVILPPAWLAQALLQSCRTAAFVSQPAQRIEPQKADPILRLIESLTGVGLGLKYTHATNQESSVNRSEGLTESAFASLTMFSSATFRSPRSTPPT